MIVTKVIEKIKENAAFHTMLQQLAELNSPYLVRYTECYENVMEYRV